MIASLLDIITSGAHDISSQPAEEYSKVEIIKEPKANEVPEEIKSATAEELAEQLVAFIKKEFPDETKIWVRNLARIFWNSKKIPRYFLPPEIELKVQKAELLAQKQIDNLEKEKIEKEKLPSLISQYVDWAREHGLKKVTKADVEAFLIEKEIDLSLQTERSLYVMTNFNLKSKK